MTPEELVNLSLNYEVEIEPFTQIPPKILLTFDFKGCIPLKLSRIPLYLALHFKSLNLCSIQTPKYLSPDFIDVLIDKEKSDQSFTDIPEFFFEHSYLFMNSDIESKICELKSLRMTKIWKGLSSIDGKALYVNGLTRWEFNEFQEIIKKSIKLGREILLDNEYE